MSTLKPTTSYPIPTPITYYKEGDTIIYSETAGKGWMNTAKEGIVIKDSKFVKNTMNEEGVYITVNPDKSNQQTIFVPKEKEELLQLNPPVYRGGKRKTRKASRRRLTRRRLTRRRR